MTTISDKTSPVGDDLLYLLDSEDSNAFKFVKISDLPQPTPSAGWELVSTWTYSTSVASVLIQNLDDYRDISVVGVGITSDEVGVRYVRVSSNNGTSYKTHILAEGTNSTNVVTTSSSDARSFSAIYEGFGAAIPKIVTGHDNQSSLGNLAILVDSTDVLNSVLFGTSEGVITGGKVYIFGRN